jgi:cytochrome bd-type quinol oxidase subunit 2
MAGIAALTPLAGVVVERSDARTIAMAAMVELGLIGLVAGVWVGRSERDRTTGAFKWLAVILFSYVPVVISFSDAGARLNQNASFSELGAIALSLVLYQAAFFLTHYLRHRRREHPARGW